MARLKVLVSGLRHPGPGRWCPGWGHPSLFQIEQAPIRDWFAIPVPLALVEHSVARDSTKRPAQPPPERPQEKKR